MVAYHEAGHALVALALPGARLPHKLSVIPRGRALGFMWDVDDGERAVQPRSDLVDQMAMLLGGRTAELLVFDEPSSGAAEDLRRVNAMARRMVGELGMSDALGGMTYTGQDGAEGRYADAELALVGAEARRLVEEAGRIARGVLERGRSSLDDVALALLEREVLSASELEAIVDPGGSRRAAGAAAPVR